MDEPVLRGLKYIPHPSVLYIYFHSPLAFGSLAQQRPFTKKDEFLGGKNI